MTAGPSIVEGTEDFPIARNQVVLAELAYASGFLVVVFLAALVLLPVGGYYAGVQLNRIEPIIACILTGVLPFIFGKFIGCATRISQVLSLAGAVAVVAISLLITVSVADTTSDGQGYHGTLIYQLLDGWNPIREPDRAETPQTAQREVMIHFTKGSEIEMAALSRGMERLEAGKAITLSLMLSTSLLTFYCLHKHLRISIGFAAVVGLVAGLNPVSVSQFLSFYVDGQLAALLTALVVCTWCLYLEGRNRHAVLLGAIILLLINTKLSGFPYVLAFGGIFFAALAVKGWMPLSALLRTYLIGITVGLVAGCNPYFFNLSGTGNPLYPLEIGGKPNAFATIFQVHQMPQCLRGRNRFQALTYSIFSRCNNDYDYEARAFPGASLKVPFTVGKGELKTFEDVDTRLCGWGPLSSGLLLLMLAGFVVPVRRDAGAASLLITIGCITFTLLVFPHTWYARYAPQIWLLPILAAVLFVSDTRRYLNYLGKIVIILAVVNIILVAVPSIGSAIVRSRKLSAQLHDLASSARVYPVEFGDYGLNKARFKEYGVNYREVPTIPSNEPQLVLAGQVLTSKTVISLARDQVKP